MFERVFCFLSEWLVHQGMNSNFETDSVEEIARKLREFYASARSVDGKPYSRSSLTNIRSGLNRFLTSPPHNRQLNVMHDRAFQSANQVYVGVIRKLRQDGLDKTKHKNAVTAGDMQLIRESGVLATDNPVGLQRKVYMEISLHFCRRGREGLRELRKDSFIVKSDENGREYVTLGYNEIEKNHQGVNKHDIRDEPRMYSFDGDACPVASFKDYIEKLHPSCNAFYQRPNLSFAKSGQWYCNMAIGKNLLAGMMKNISEAAGTSKKYTNHCLRVTAVSVLHARGVAPMDICSVSRHKNTESLKSYSHGPSDERRYSMSAMLHEHGKQKTAVVPVSCKSSSPRPSTSTGIYHDSQSAASPQPSTSRDSQLAVLSAETDCVRESQVTATNNTAISNRSDNIVQKALFAGAHFEANCAPVFHFHGNFIFQ